MLLDEIKINKTVPKHPEYEDLMKEVAFWRLSFDCGIDYLNGIDSKGDKIVPKKTCEEWYEYEERIKTCGLRPLAGSIIQKFRNYVFRNDPIRSEIDETFYYNCDLYGSSLDDFFADVLIKAQVDGSCYILPDFTQVDRNVLTLAQSREIEQRGFLRKIKRDSVVNWNRIDSYLVESIIIMEDDEGNTFARYINDKVYVDILLDQKTLRVSEITEAVQHNFSSFPLIEATSEWFSGGSQIASMCWSQKKIHNYLSLLGTEIENNTFTRHLLFLEDLPTDEEGKPVVPDVIVGPKRINVVVTGQGGKGEIKSVGNASPDQAESIRKSLEEEISNLYNISGLGTPSALKDGVQAQSGAAIYLETNNTYVVLDSLVREIESVENEIIKLLYPNYEGTNYSHSFVLETAEEALNRIRDLRANGFPEEIIVNEMTKFVENHLK